MLGRAARLALLPARAAGHVIVWGMDTYWDHAQRKADREYQEYLRRQRSGK